MQHPLQIVQATWGESALVLEPVSCRGEGWDGGREGGPKAGRGGGSDTAKGWGTHPAPADTMVQLKVLLPTPVNQWLCYYQAPGSLIYTT